MGLFMPDNCGECPQVTLIINDAEKCCSYRCDLLMKAVWGCRERDEDCPLVAMISI